VKWRWRICTWKITPRWRKKQKKKKTRYKFVESRVLCAYYVG
jgi:hypothetical protein